MGWLAAHRAGGGCGGRAASLGDRAARPACVGFGWRQPHAAPRARGMTASRRRGSAARRTCDALKVRCDSASGSRARGATILRCRVAALPRCPLPVARCPVSRARCPAAFPTRPRGWFVPAANAGGGCPEPAMDGRRPHREQDAHISGWASPSCIRGRQRTSEQRARFPMASRTGSKDSPSPDASVETSVERARSTLTQAPDSARSTHHLNSTRLTASTPMPLTRPYTVSWPRA